MFAQLAQEPWTQTGYCKLVSMLISVDISAAKQCTNLNISKLLFIHIQLN